MARCHPCSFPLGDLYVDNVKNLVAFEGTQNVFRMMDRMVLDGLYETKLFFTKILAVGGSFKQRPTMQTLLGGYDHFIDILHTPVSTPDHYVLQGMCYRYIAQLMKGGVEQRAYDPHRLITDPFIYCFHADQAETAAFFSSRNDLPLSCTQLLLIEDVCWQGLLDVVKLALVASQWYVKNI